MLPGLRKLLGYGFRQVQRPRLRHRPKLVARVRLEQLEDRWTPALTYHGGPLLAKVQIEALYYSPWNTTSTLQSQKATLDSYFSFLAKSTYIDILAQYSIGGTTIGRGSFTGDDSTFPSATTQNITINGSSYKAIDDSQIQSDLSTQIHAGNNKLTTPNANTLYFVFTPPGVVVTASGLGNSVQNFLGYHGWFFDSASGKNVIYAVMPYSDGITNASISELTALQNLEEVASHETAEAITDPLLSSWYDDSSGGEVGDLCNATYGTLNGFVVQNLFSNATNSSATAVGTNFYISGFSDPTEGQFSGVVATFVDTSGSGNVSSVFVSWGDGTADVLSGFVIHRVNSTTFQVLASHTYTDDEGTTLDPFVFLTLADGSQASAAGEVDVVDFNGIDHFYTDKGLVTLTDAAVEATPLNVTAVPGTAYTGAVATFTDPAGPEPNDASHYTATISWGDNTPRTAGTISFSNGVFTVSSSPGHSYGSAGSFTITCTINHEGVLTTVTSPVTVQLNTTTTTTTVTSSANPQTAGQPISWTATVAGSGGPANSVDFETGDFTQTATHTASGTSVVTSPALDGAYSLRLQRSNSYANVEIRQSGTTYYNLPTAYYQFLFEFTSNPAEGGVVNFQDTASGFKAALHLSAADTLLLYDSSGTLRGTGSTVLQAEQVYVLSAKIGTGPSAAWEVRINGTVEMSGSNNLGTANNGSLKLGGNALYTDTYYYDDVSINSQAYAGTGPTGTVQFQIDGTSFGVPVTLTNGVATSQTMSTLPAGSHTITAIYSGDANFSGSTGTLTQTVTGTTAAGTTTTVSSSANPQTAGQPVSWTATVMPSTGLVNWVNFETGDFSQTASHTSSGAAIVTSPLLNGSEVLQLLRSNSIASVEIRQSGTTYYNLPTAYYQFLFEFTSNPAEGGVVNFQDTASGFKAALHLSAADKLLFYDSTGTVRGTGSTVLQAEQVYVLSAKIGTGPSAAWEVRINGTVEMSGSNNLGTANNGSLKLGGNSPYTATYYYDDVAINSQAYPGPVPTGTVQFVVDGSNFGSPVSLSDGMATSQATSTLAAGSHTVTASYSGDSSYAPSSGSLSGGQTISSQSSQINVVNFETGDFSQTATHTSTGTAVVTSPALDGTYSLQLLRSNSIANVEIRQSGTTYYNLPTAYYQFLFEYTSNPAEGGVVNFQDTASGFKAALHLSAADKLLFYDSTGTVRGTGSTVLQAGQVYVLSAKIGTGPSAAWEVRINGTVEMSGSNNLGTANNGSLKLGGNSPYTATYYYDDVAINSQGYPGGGGGAAPRGPSRLIRPETSVNTKSVSSENLISSMNGSQNVPLPIIDRSIPPSSCDPGSLDSENGQEVRKRLQDSRCLIDETAVSDHTEDGAHLV